MTPPKQNLEQKTIAEESRHSSQSDNDPQSNYNFYNKNIQTIQSTGAYLPHWHQDAVIYFVTFRLADSLPQEKLKALQKEKENWLIKHPEPHSKDQKDQFYQKFTHSIHQWLDNAYGSLLLKNKDARQIVENALAYFNGDRYKLDSFVVAANHVHALVAPIETYSLSDITHSWKSFSAKSLLRLPNAQNLATAPTVWQKESWDHIVRSEFSLQKFRAYIQSHGDHAHVAKASP